jgi:hypothetical protein
MVAAWKEQGVVEHLRLMVSTVEAIRRNSVRTVLQWADAKHWHVRPNTSRITVPTLQ